MKTLRIQAPENAQAALITPLSGGNGDIYE